jgi:UDP-N-acetylglucosamine acyltransferase
MPIVHASASVSPRCRIGEGVRIGPGCVIEGEVVLGDGVELIANVYVRGPVTIKAGTVLYPGVCVGFSAQHLRVGRNDPTAGVLIGERCTLRENATVHAATSLDVPTRIGNDCFMMVNAHAGHDCDVGANVTLVNNTALGGHVVIGDQVTLGGGTLVHQFTRVGRLCMVGGGARVVADVPPFSMVVERSHLAGVNLIGLRRAGIGREDITKVRVATRLAFREPRTREEMLQVLDEHAAGCPMVGEIAAFVRAAKRPISVGTRRIESDAVEA